jgi:hypothetical protein
MNAPGKKARKPTSCAPPERADTAGSSGRWSSPTTPPRRLGAVRPARQALTPGSAKGALWLLDASEPQIRKGDETWPR